MLLDEVCSILRVFGNFLAYATCYVANRDSRTTHPLSRSTCCTNCCVRNVAGTCRSNLSCTVEPPKKLLK